MMDIIRAHKRSFYSDYSRTKAILLALFIGCLGGGVEALFILTLRVRSQTSKRYLMTAEFC